MLNKKIENILNIQVEKEGYSSNLYLAMASWAETKGFNGITKWLYVQSEEERVHMLKIIGYINERGGKAIIPQFKQPPVEQKSVKEMFEEVLKHEQFISASIHEIVAASIEEKDYATQNWIQWFVKEQIEEETSAQKILDRLELIGEAKAGLYMLDREIMSLRGE